MSKNGKGGKLGRNPLDHLQDYLDQPLPPASFNAIHGDQKIGKTPTALSKIKEMKLEVDWEELYRSTLGQQVKKLGRFFSIY